MVVLTAAKGSLRNWRNYDLVDDRLENFLWDFRLL